MKILIAAGGSGGHIFPAIALARHLKKNGRAGGILFVGSDKELDKKIFERDGFKYALLSANKLPFNAGGRALPLFFVKLFFDTMRAFFISASYRPDVVIGFGGYVSWPAVISARLLGIPGIIHEQNVVPGRANKFLFRIADRIALTFDETKGYTGKDTARAVVTGNPIRASDFKGDRLEGLKNLGLGEGKFTILLIGGSQGAHFLNETFIAAVEKMPEERRASLQVIHITGVKDYEEAKRRYCALGAENRVFSFIDRIEDAYNAADLIVTRAGSSALFEIAFFRKPMVLVPYPFAASHQSENARVFAEKGAAIVMEEKALSAEIFKDSILKLIADRNKLEEMAGAAGSLSEPAASGRLAEEVLRLGEKR